jgi:hypothetical protein
LFAQVQHAPPTGRAGPAASREIMRLKESLAI